MSGFFGGPSMANMMNDPRYKKQVADAFNPAISTMNVSPTGGTGVPGQKKETLAIKAGDANISQNNTGKQVAGAALSAAGVPGSGLIAGLLFPPPIKHNVKPGELNPNAMEMANKPWMKQGMNSIWGPSRSYAIT